MLRDACYGLRFHDVAICCDAAFRSLKLGGKVPQLLGLFLHKVDSRVSINAGPGTGTS